MTHDSAGSQGSHCARCQEPVLEALYTLNALAKEYAQSAEEAYDVGRKAAARACSQKKKALYGLKRSILGEFVERGCVDEIRYHEIDGRQYYCVYVGDRFSFHTPVSEWDRDTLPQDVPESVKELSSFDSDPNTRHTEMDEREALTRLAETFDSPNHFLEDPFLDTGYGVKFNGWRYLPGSLQEGDRVPERYLHDHVGPDRFDFEIGDTFETEKGHCEIVDRYHAYLPPRSDRSPVRQRPVYDVRRNGELIESIRPRTILKDWRVVAQSIADPLPNVDGSLSDQEFAYTQSASQTDGSVEFEIGDILELQIPGAGDTLLCRFTDAYVELSLLYGEYEPVAPTERAPMGMALADIVDDVVAVHDEPPAQE